MFAQWMHHVYPRECPYPHLSGTTKRLQKTDFVKQTGLGIHASVPEMKQTIEEGAGWVGVSEIMWSDEDEFYVERPALPVWGSERSSVWTIARFVVFFIPAFSTAVFLLRLGRTADECAYGGQACSKSHYV